MPSRVTSRIAESSDAAFAYDVREKAMREGPSSFSVECNSRILVQAGCLSTVRGRVKAGRRPPGGLGLDAAVERETLAKGLSAKAFLAGNPDGRGRLAPFPLAGRAGGQVAAGRPNCDCCVPHETAQSLREYERATWGRWDVARTQRQIEDDIAAGRLNIIEVDLRMSGMMRVDEYPTHMHLDQLFLLPEYQGRGVGTSLVEDLLRGARLKNLPVKLWVFQVNPARRLYERMGFQVVEQTAASLYLQSAA